MTGAAPAALLLALAALAGASPARADCYDLLGCSERDLFSRHFGYLASPTDGPNCEFLREMREAIVAEGNARSVSTGNTADRAQAGGSPSRIERANVATIRRAEALKRCRS